MKLYIIRHAKSSWKDLELDDFERPLNKRGRANAPFMGKILKEKNIKPDVILSSPALRAKSTAEIIVREANYSKEIVFKENLYEASLNALLKTLRNVDDANDVVFLFGHNFSINDFVEEYVNLYENVPTCGVVEMEFDCDSWREIDATNAKLISFDYPKKHR